MAGVTTGRRWSILWLLFVAGFINYLDRATLSVALPLVSTDLHLDPAAKGMVLSAFFWSYALMQVPMGWCADRWGLRWFYAGMFTLWSLACGFMGFASTLAALLALRVLLGIGESIYLPGGIKTVSVLFDAGRRGLASGLVNCGTRLGLAFGAPMVAWLVVRFGWRRTFVLAGFAGLVWVIPWLLAYPSARRTVTVAPSTEAGSRHWRDRNLLALCLGHLGFSYYWTLLVTWLPTYLVEARRIPIQTAGMLAMLPYFVFSVSEPLGGWLADRLVKLGWEELRVRKGIITFAFLTSLALLPAAGMADDGTAICLIGVASMVGLATGNILALLQRIAPSSDVGLWTGILNCGGNLAGAAAPLATGLLIGRTASYLPGFALAVTVLIAALPAYWLLTGDRKEPSISRNNYAEKAL